MTALMDGTLWLLRLLLIALVIARISKNGQRRKDRYDFSNYKEKKKQEMILHVKDVMNEVVTYMHIT